MLPSRFTADVQYAVVDSSGPCKRRPHRSRQDCAAGGNRADRLNLGRCAWLLVEAINEALREPAVSAATGGQHGGGAMLTPTGERIIDLYRAIEGHARSSASEEFRALARITRKDAKARK
jgi:molybdate transport system regulatory protein